ncbi:MAG: HNH endonuclease [Cytophagales bacterium]|nr:MAG: HNH endonuclease [Cytophagales bacterium]
MAIFRNQTPQRRTTVKIKAKYGYYKDDLQRDFNFRCGYCDDLDSYRKADYQIDHFVPHEYCKTIQKNTYSNLVYSCRNCNRAKWHKFPTQDENIHHDGKVGFIDPCHNDYANQFERERGKIIPITPLGEYMWREIHLYLLRHELIHTLERLDDNIRELRNLNLPDGHIARAILSQMCEQAWEIREQLTNG